MAQLKLGPFNSEYLFGGFLGGDERRRGGGDIGWGLLRHQGCKFPGAAVAEQAGDEAGVHGVAGSFSDDFAEDMVAGEGEIAY